MVVIIVQARMGSTRLPGKVLKPIAGRPMLSYQIERLRRVQRGQQLVVATTINPLDDAIVSFCRDAGVDCCRGSEQDVLSRYWQAAEQFAATTVVRVTADCPLLDPQLVDLAIETFVDHAGRYDYVSNMITPTWPYGMAVEVLSEQVLREANRESIDAAEREHVTPFVYLRPDRYRIKSLTRHPDLSWHRWTVDTPEDFQLVSLLLESLYPRRPAFTIDDVLATLDRHPDWANINAHVAQKSIEQRR
ncbi:MAG: cytidylyltransferase domain-containing protein [Steroidobacteraceae bacterium]